MLENDPSGNGNLEPVPPSDRDLAFRRLLELENARIDANNRQVALAEKALAQEDVQDQRQFEFASATRDANIGLRRERFAFLRRVTWSCAAFAALLILALLGFALFGNDEQRTLAAKIAVPGLIGLAGYGVIATLGRVVKAFTRESD